MTEGHANPGDDEPVTLAEACKLFFSGRLKPSALRTEAAKGNLEIFQIARKDFVTKRAVEEMMQRCRKSPNLPACGSERRSAAEPDSSQSRGVSKTEGGLSAQDVLRMRLSGQGKNSPSISL